jgi:hypothetical protein
MTALLAGASVPLIHRDNVFHVGTLQVDDKDRQNKPSLEAFCVSVSLHPEEWMAVARIGGAPTWALERPGSAWLDVLALSKAQEAAIIDWGVAEGYAAPTTLWRSWFYDSEADCMGYMQWNDEISANNEIDEDDEASFIDSVDSHRLTPEGMALLERWRDDKTCLDGLTILWADRVLAPQLPELAGLWWDEDYDIMFLSCPRGGVLPSRLDQFTRTIALPDATFDHDWFDNSVGVQP